jgi:hypothetical protein
MARFVVILTELFGQSTTATTAAPVAYNIPAALHKGSIAELAGDKNVPGVSLREVSCVLGRAKSRWLPLIYGGGNAEYQRMQETD